MKILANEIASRIADAQKSSVSGQLNSNASSGWRPSYGIYFDTTNNKNFIHFADLNNNGYYDSSTDSILDQTSITNGNTVSALGVVGTGCPTITNLNVVFKRPDSGAIITSTPQLTCTITYAQITVSSSASIISTIKIYPSGRIQIN